MKLRLWFAICLVLSLPNPLHAAEDKLTVAVASNVKFAFEDLASAFTRETGVAVHGIFSASGKIVAQVKAGAPYDFFLSADMAYPEQLQHDHLTATAPRIYAYGKLAAWSKSRDIELDPRLTVLAQKGIKRVVIANPKLAPYGHEAISALDKLGLKRALQGKPVFAENVSQILQYVDSGNADVGITAKSLAIAPGMAGKGRWIDLPADVYQPIAQGAVILRHGRQHHADAAEKFYEFLFSEKGRAILAGFDYGLP